MIVIKISDRKQPVVTVYTAPPAPTKPPAITYPTTPAPTPAPGAKVSATVYVNPVLSIA